MPGTILLRKEERYGEVWVDRNVPSTGRDGVRDFARVDAGRMDQNVRRTERFRSATGQVRQAIPIGKDQTGERRPVQGPPLAATPTPPHGAQRRLRMRQRGSDTNAARRPSPELAGHTRHMAGEVDLGPTVTSSPQPLDRNSRPGRTWPVVHRRRAHGLPSPQGAKFLRWPRQPGVSLRAWPAARLQLS